MAERDFALSRHVLQQSELRVRPVRPADDAEQRAALDLASWEVALNGAEPVRRHTIDEFARLFGPAASGANRCFRPMGSPRPPWWYPEGRAAIRRCAIEFDAAEMERDRVVEIRHRQRHSFPCGLRHAQSSRRRFASSILPPARLGERTRSVRSGCGDAVLPPATGIVRTKPSRPSSAHSRRQRRIVSATGDLGFLRDGELFITGRLKDLIIIRGANHYPQDIEWTVEQSHHALRPGCGAAFSVDIDGTEELVVVFELEREHLRTVDPEELARAARRSVAEEHDLHLHAFVLLKTGSVPRTTSGKIQRRQCRADFLSRELPVVWESDRQPPWRRGSRRSAARRRQQPPIAAALTRRPS